MWALAALAAAALALPVFFGSALTAMDAVAIVVLAWVLLGRAVGVTWSDVWRMGASDKPNYITYITLSAFSCKDICHAFRTSGPVGFT